jgi:hypothetical protein
MCTLAAGIGALGAIAQFSAQQSATKEYNEQAAIAHRDAEVAASYKYTDLDRKYVYDSASLNQEGYKDALKARSEQATGIASAGSAGIAGGSITLQNLVGASIQTAANNEANIQTKRDDSKDSLQSNLASVNAEAQQRINSVPFKAGPNPLGLAINIASAGLGGLNSSSSGSNGLKFDFG